MKSISKMRRIKVITSGGQEGRPHGAAFVARSPLRPVLELSFDHPERGSDEIQTVADHPWKNRAQPIPVARR